MANGQKIRVGIVGVGNWGRYGHIPALQLLPEYDIVAVASRRKKYGEELAEQFGISHVFEEAKNLSEDSDVDLVIVLPPAPQHASLVRAVIAAGKDVFCEWPLTTDIADSEELLSLADAAGVRHVVGLQRRLGPSARYVHDLIEEGYVGDIRSVRMHVSMSGFNRARSAALDWTIDPKNFSHILAIYGGHFMDMMFRAVGPPAMLSAEVANQFPTVTILETGKAFATAVPDQALIIGSLANGGVFSIQIEGGKLSNRGLQIDITGTEGDLKISNSRSFGTVEDNKVEGARGADADFLELPIPAAYDLLPPSTLDVSVLDLAHLYAAFAKDRATGSQDAPTFVEGVRMHKLINLIIEASVTGKRQLVDFW